MKRIGTALVLSALLAAVVLVRSGPGPAKVAATATATPHAVTPIRPDAEIAPDRLLPPPSPPGPVEDIAQSLRSGNEFDRNRVFQDLLPKLVAANPHEAGLLAEEWPPGPQRDELLREVTRLWTARDFAGAMTWLASLASRRDQGNAAPAGAAEIARTDPAGAAEMAQIFQAGTGDGSLEHLVQIWTEENPRAAVDWTLARPADVGRDLLLARIAYVRAQQAPADAAALVVDFMGAGARRDDAIAAVARQWAGRDPAAASAWVAQFPAGPLRARSLVAVDAGRKMR